jgi:hypothetical protein
MQNYTNGDKYIYVAIRRPNMATITDATEVFHIEKSSSNPVTSISFPADLQISNWVEGHTSSSDAKYKNVFVDRLRGFPNADQTGSKSLTLALTSISDASESSTTALEPTFNVFNSSYNRTDSGGSGLGAEVIIYSWKRAKGYFDIAAYTGNGSTQNINHGLSVSPEMIWLKSRTDTSDWMVSHKDLDGSSPYNYNLKLNDVGNRQNNTDRITAVSSTTFSLGNHNSVNKNNSDFIAYLFATLAGVSKVGSVTHSGSSTNVDCGFSSGSRFVLLKRYDVDGSWYIWDSTRGIIAGNDPYQLLNSNTRQVTNTDLIDPLSSGFQISDDLTDGDYIFYAIA